MADWVCIPDSSEKCSSHDFYVKKCKEACQQEGKKWTARSDCSSKPAYAHCNERDLKCECTD
jgi:hypothetical protein